MKTATINLSTSRIETVETPVETIPTDGPWLYRVEFLGITCGHMVLESRHESRDDQELVHIVMRAWNSKFFNRIYRVDARIDSWVDPPAGTSLELSARVKLPAGVGDCHLEARMEGLNAQGRDIPHFPRQTHRGPGDGTYRKITVTWDLPPDSRRVLVRILARAPAGSSICVDDIVLVDRGKP